MELRKTVFLSEKRPMETTNNIPMMKVPYIAFINGKWLEDTQYFLADKENEFIKACKKEGFLIK